MSEKTPAPPRAQEPTCHCEVYETCETCRGTNRDLSVCHCDQPYLCGMKDHKETWRCLRCGRHPSADEEVFVSYVDEIEVKLSDALARLAARSTRACAPTPRTR